VSNHINRIGAGVLAAAIACSFAAPAFAAPASDNAPTDRFIVKFKPGTNEQKSSAARKRMIDAAGMGQGLHLGHTRRLAVGADLMITDRKLDSRAAQAFMHKLRQDPRVQYVQVDRRLHKLMTPNDSLYAADQWDLSDNTAGIRAPLAWNVATGSGVVVAVIDTGITDHLDLGTNILPGYDFIAEDDVGVFKTANDGDGRDPDAHDPGDWVVADECGTGSRAEDSSWHGTHVSGTIAALTNNAKGVAGIAFNAKVQPVRVLGKCGGYTSDIADAIIWASGGSVPGIPANPTPAEVINMSLGGPGSCDALTQEAVNIAVANGTTVVVAAGNDSKDAAGFTPASCDNLVAVAATTKTGGKAGYSNTGDKVDLGAPGGNTQNPIWSTLNAGTTNPGPASVEFYQHYTGTSMASPHVAGVVALMQSKAVNTPAMVETILKGSARPFPASCVGCGAGLLTAPDALNLTTTPFLYINDLPSVIEGDFGTKVVNFKVRLTAAQAGPVTFNIATADDTATAGSDYVAVNVTGATIPAGQMEYSFAVTVNGDATIESAETFKVIVSNVTGITGAGLTARETLINDDGPILDNGVPVTGLAASIGTISLYKMVVPANATNLTFTTAGTSDTEDVDIYARYGVPPSTGVFDEVSGGPDTNEQIVVQNPQAGTWYLLVNAYTTYANVTLTGSYTDGGAGTPSLSVNDASVTEGNSGTKLMTFTATLSATSASPVNFNYTTIDGTALGGEDFVSQVSIPQTIAAGQLSKTFTVTINGDTKVESNETFGVNLSQVTGATVADGSGTGTITNDDSNAVPSLSINNASVTEGNSGTKLLTFTASLSQASANVVTFNAATQSGTATVGSDFVGFTPTGFNIPAGQLSTLVSVTINGDTTIEPNETFNVNLSSVAGATLLDGQGVGTITNDDTSTPTLRINDVAVAEGNSGTKVLTFTATLSQVSDTIVTFNAATQSDTAAVGSDFVGFAPTGFNIPAGQLTTPVSVTINGDTTIEPNETLKVNLSSVVGATLLDGQGIGTITNDDTSTPTLSINDATLVEGNSGGTRVMAFTVSLSQAAATTVTFNAATQSGTATVGSDFVGFGPTAFSIPAGQLAKAVLVTINSDTVIEPTETFKVNLSSVNGATLVDGQGIGTITNDDFSGLRINDVSISEGNAGTKVLTFTASLSQALGNAVTFNAATQSGTAAVGSDFVGFPATGFNIPAGQLTTSVNVTINGDTTTEANETFNVNLSSVVGTTLLDGQGVGTITNDD
jgi:serine protease